MSLAVSKGGKLINGSADKTIKVWNILTGENLKKINENNPVTISNQ